MKKVFRFLALLTFSLLVLTGFGCETKTETALPALPGQNVTPLIGQVLVEPHAVKLSDGKTYLMYELMVTNATSIDYLIEKLTLEDPLNKNAVVGEYTADDIKSHLQPQRKAGPTNVVKAYETSLITFCLTFEGNKTPKAIDHVLSVKTGSPISILPGEADERIARTKVNTAAPVVIGPPLKGDNWFAANVADNYGHRNALFPLNGSWIIPERWAVDYIQLDSENRVATGDADVLSNYPGYDSDLLAVKDGTVLDVIDEFADLKIGETLANLDLSTAGGNYVVIDIGGGYSAFYAHMIKGTVKVKKGDKVKKGQVLGKLGNSGNSTGPHLHFHIVKGKDPLASQGVPYVIDKFSVTGQSATAELAEPFFTGAPLATSAEFTGSHANQMPADNTIVTFKPPAPKKETTE